MTTILGRTTPSLQLNSLPLPVFSNLLFLHLQAVLPCPSSKAYPLSFLLSLTICYSFQRPIPRPDASPSFHSFYGGLPLPPTVSLFCQVFMLPFNHLSLQLSVPLVAICAPIYAGQTFILNKDVNDYLLTNEVDGTEASESVPSPRNMTRISACLCYASLTTSG